eukprot:RCo007845
MGAAKSKQYRRPEEYPPLPGAGSSPSAGIAEVGLSPPEQLVVDVLRDCHRATRLCESLCPASMPFRLVFSMGSTDELQSLMAKANRHHSGSGLPLTRAVAGVAMQRWLLPRLRRVAEVQLWRVPVNGFAMESSAAPPSSPGSSAFLPPVKPGASASSSSSSNGLLSSPESRLPRLRHAALPSFLPVNPEAVHPFNAVTSPATPNAASLSVPHLTSTTPAFTSPSSSSSTAGRARSPVFSPSGYQARGLLSPPAGLSSLWSH